MAMAFPRTATFAASLARARPDRHSGALFCLGFSTQHCRIDLRAIGPNDQRDHS